MIDMMTLLQESNPIPDPTELIDSPEGQALALRRPNSVVDWYARDGDFEGDGYRIRFVSSKNWEVSHRGELIGNSSRKSAAFSVVEHHRREALWRRDMWVRASIAVLAFIALVVLAAFSEVPGLWFLGIIIIGIGFSATVRFLSVLNRHVDDPYRRQPPWERVSWWRRFRG